MLLKHLGLFAKARRTFWDDSPITFPDKTSGMHREKFQCKHWNCWPPPDASWCLPMAPDVPEGSPDPRWTPSRCLTMLINFHREYIAEAKNAQWDLGIRRCTRRGYDFFCKYHVINHEGNWLGTFLDNLWINKETITRAEFEPATSGLTCWRSTNRAN